MLVSDLFVRVKSFPFKLMWHVLHYLNAINGAVIRTEQLNSLQLQVFDKFGTDFDLLSLYVSATLGVTLAVEKDKVIRAEHLFLRENLDDKAAPVLDAMLLQSFLAFAEDAPEEAI